MKFAHFSHVWNKPGMTPAERYEQLWRELKLADESGFDFGFCVEHHFNPNESWMPSPSIYCAAAAALTKRVRIGTMGYVVPLYDPLRIAEDVAVLGNVANGRFELGLVSGIEQAGITRQMTRGHMSLEEIGKMAASADVKTVVLSHLTHKRDGDYTPWAEEVKKHFSGPVLVAKDLMEF